MTYGRVCFVNHALDAESADVSHLAELVSGDLFRGQGLLIRSFGPPSPVALEARLRHDGEKGPVGFLVWIIRAEIPPESPPASLPT